MNLPAHLSLSIEHNEHKGVYETVEEWLTGPNPPDFESPAARQACIDTNELWTMQWYPTTPNGFNIVGAPTLDDLLRYANAYNA